MYNYPRLDSTRSRMESLLSGWIPIPNIGLVLAPFETEKGAVGNTGNRITAGGAP